MSGPHLKPPKAKREQKKFEPMPARLGFRGIPYMNDFQSVKQRQAIDADL
jgi:hypothetical protein